MGEQLMEEQSWWLIATSRVEVLVWHLGDATGDDVAELVDAARVVLGIPAGDAVWDVQLTYGEPHRTLLARATLRDPGELLAVTPQQLEEYRATVHAANRLARMDAARAVLADLTADEFQTVTQEVA